MLKVKKILGASALAFAVAMPVQADLVLDTFEYSLLDLTIAELGDQLDIINDPMSTPAEIGAAAAAIAAADAAEADLTFQFNDNGLPGIVVGDQVLFFDTIPPGEFGAAVPLGTPGLLTSSVTGETGTYVGLSEFNGLAIYDFGASAPASQLTTGNGTLAVTSAPGAQWDLTLSYSDPFGGADSEDFAAAGENFYVDIESKDAALAGTTFTVDVTVFDADGMSDTVAFNIPNAEITSTTRQLLSFGNFSGVDFARVTGVVADITSAGGQGSLDIVLSEFGIVPEPTSIALLGLGLLGLGGASRRRLK